MSTNTKIEWTDATWNPVVGCSRVSAGCRNCYAHQLHDMRHKAYQEGKALPGQYAKPFTTLQLMPDRLRDPLGWRKPRRVFVNSVSDLFHEDVPAEFIGRVWDTMASAHRHVFQVLTKRPARMLELVPTFAARHTARNGTGWPLSNVQLGVSVEDQRAADERIHLLLKTPAAVRFISGEPLLGPVDLKNISGAAGSRYQVLEPVPGHRPRIDWVIAGGESGKGARPMHTDWARSLRDQCQAAGVPFFFKQWGEWAPYNLSRDPTEELAKLLNPKTMDFPVRAGKKVAGRLLDGREWNEFPEKTHA